MPIAFGFEAAVRFDHHLAITTLREQETVQVTAGSTDDSEVVDNEEEEVEWLVGIAQDAIEREHFSRRLEVAPFDKVVLASPPAALEVYLDDLQRAACDEPRKLGLNARGSRQS